jgi:hypothetical protein
MRHVAFLDSIVVLIGCKTNSVPRSPSEASHPAEASAQEPQEAPGSTPLKFLVNAAATDFHTHQPSQKLSFRNVRLGRVMTPEGEKQYLLCGQFLPAATKGKPDWVPFATIQTSGYEQWLGDQAASICARPSILWEDGDLTPSLESRFDSLQ